MSTLEQKRSNWLAILESYQHRFHIAREDITAKFHKQQQAVDMGLRNDFCFMSQKRLERDVASLFDRYQTEVRALRRAENEREYAKALNHLKREEQEVIHQHQLMFPLPTISVPRVPTETPFRPTSTAMVSSPTIAHSWPTEIQDSLSHEARFREGSYQQSHILSMRHTASNDEFALRSDNAVSLTHSMMPRSHPDFHSDKTLEIDRLRHNKPIGFAGHPLASWHAEDGPHSQPRIHQFQASEANHSSTSLPTVRYDQLMRTDGQSSQTKNRETAMHVSSNRNREHTTPSKERIEFDEVYQDGKAEFKHTIVKFSDKFYILKCDKHGVHFRQNALIAAAKHLNSALHGFMKKDFRQAIELLGIRVSNCTDALAKLNNDCVRHAFEMGYKPMNLLRSRYYSSNRRSRHDTPTPSPERSISLPAVSREIPETERALEDVLNPTPGELYWANCPKANKASVVMALGWKDLSMCGRNEMFCDLALHKEMPRPRCYEFDDEGIVGWAAGYRDGESLASSREVPVMRCESNGEDSFMWTSVRLLTPFRLDDPDRRCDADAGELRTRQIYARVRGFESFESMLAYKAIKEDPRQEYSRTLPKSHRMGNVSESELQSTGPRSLRPCDSGTEVFGDDAVTEMRSAASTDPRDFDNVQDSLRSTVESACPSLSHTPDIQNADLVCQDIHPKDSPATPMPLNAERRNQPGKVHTFETTSLPNSREETASHSPGASVASFLEQLPPGQNREERTRTCTPHAEHHADTIEVMLSPQNGSSHQQPRLEADRQHSASTRARHRRQSQRAVVRQLRSRFMSTDSHTSATRRK